MVITWHGLSCFSFQVKTFSGQATFVINPFENTKGLRFPRTLSADLVAVSSDRPEANNVSALLSTREGGPFVVRLPGEYEVNSCFIYGFAAPRQKSSEPHLIFRGESEGLGIVHLGFLDRPLTEAETEQLGEVDVLLLPIGSPDGLEVAGALEVVEEIEPRLVIPYSSGNLEAFCKAIGSCERLSGAKIKVTKKELPADGLKVCVLSRE